jgi:FkbM family methyltransferase
MSTPPPPSSTPLQLATEIVKGPDGTFIILSGDLLGGHIKRGDPWEPHFTKLVKQLVQAGAQVIDVGANFGLNTVVLGKQVGPEGVVIAIEPLRVIFQQLCGNCFLNGLANVITLNAAVGATTGIIEMNPVDYFAQGWNFGDTQVGSGGERVQMVTLDSLGLSSASFIKIDVQGSELEVLRGAHQTIFSGRPYIFIQIEEPQLVRRGTTGQEVIQHIISLGYVLIHIRNEYPVDYLCVPQEKRGELVRYMGYIDAPTSVIEA